MFRSSANRGKPTLPRVYVLPHAEHAFSQAVESTGGLCAASPQLPLGQLPLCMGCQHGVCMSFSYWIHQERTCVRACAHVLVRACSHVCPKASISPHITLRTSRWCPSPEPTCGLPRSIPIQSTGLWKGGALHVDFKLLLVKSKVSTQVFARLRFTRSLLSPHPCEEPA